MLPCITLITVKTFGTLSKLAQLIALFSDFVKKVFLPDEKNEAVLRCGNIRSKFNIEISVKGQKVIMN